MGPERLGEQHRQGGRHREHAGFMPAGETQITGGESPADKGLENVVGENVGHGYRHGYQHGSTPSAHHEARQEKDRRRHGNRDPITETCQPAQQRRMPTKIGLNPGVDCRVERAWPPMVREQHSEEHRDRDAYGEERDGEGAHLGGHQRAGSWAPRPLHELPPVTAGTPVIPDHTQPAVRQLVQTGRGNTDLPRSRTWDNDLAGPATTAKQTRHPDNV
jgi:hypothetical protein